jgi:hypothetical protein
MRRLRILGLVALVALAACQGAAGPTPITIYVTPTPIETEAPVDIAPAVTGDCRSVIGPFVDALFELDSRLNVGMSFSEYSDKVAAARVTYDRIHIDQLDAACLESVGAPAEAAFNNYIYAYRIWNACMDKLACTLGSIRPKLQAYWAKATGQIDKFRDVMK